MAESADPMSRMRITAKLRKNQCFIEATRMLDELGLHYDVHPPTGKGHPFLLIKHPDPDHDPIKHLVACTPKSYATGPRAVASLRRKLQAAGLIARE